LAEFQKYQAGTILLAALPIITGNQLLAAYVDHDVRNIPERIGRDKP